MSLVRFAAKNHPQQTDLRGALDEVDDRGTPPELFDPLEAEFGFTLDVAAAHHNACCPAYYTRAEDGLAQPWFGSVWCNPPYSGLWGWLAKAWQEWSIGHCHCIVLMLPANRCEQRWWQDHIEPHRDRDNSPLSTRFLPGRPRFIMPGHDAVLPNQRPPFGLVLAIWSRAAVT